MSEYEEFIKLRNRMLKSDFELFEEDVQLIDRFLDDYEQKDQQIAELQAKVKELEESEKLGIEYDKNAKKCIEYWQKEYNALKNQFDMLNKKYIEEMNKTDNLQSLPKQVEEIKTEIKKERPYLCETDNVALLLRNDILKDIDNLLKNMGKRNEQRNII